jgi:hypothetical protein
MKHAAWVIAVVMAYPLYGCLDVMLTVSDGEAKMIEAYREREEAARKEAAEEARALRLSDDKKTIIVDGEKN